VARNLQNLDLQHLPIQWISAGFQLGLLLFHLHLLLTHIDVRFLKRGASAINLSQRMLDGANRGDRRYVQSHLHELGVRLVEVAGVALDHRQAILNVFQHQVVLRLLDLQSRVHVADD